MSEKNATLRKIVLPERGVETLFGPYDENIKILEELLSVRVTVRGNDILIEGEEGDVDAVQRIIEDYTALLDKGQKVTNAELKAAFKQIAEDRAYSLQAHMKSGVINPTGKKPVSARSVNQRRYLEAIDQHDVVFGIGVAGTGKCIAESSLVLTDRGIVEIGSLGEGAAPDEYRPVELGICGLNGEEAASHVYCGGESATVRLTTRFGYAIEATPEHPLVVLDANGHLVWRRADRILVGDVVALQRGQRLFGTRTEVAFAYEPVGGRTDCSKPVALDEIDEQIAYFMGVVTGDGCLTVRNRVVVSTADEEIVDTVHAIAARFGLHVFRNVASSRPYDYVVASAQLYQLLEHLGMSTGKAATKRIPRAILAAPEPLVAAFLRGLFDADGSVEKRDGTITFNSTSDELVRQVQVVLLNFGIVANRRVKLGRYCGEVHRSHLLAIAGAEAESFHDMIGFGVARKRARRIASTPNPNVDVIPHVGRYLTAAARTTTLSRAEHQIFGDYRRERRRPSYAQLDRMLDVLSAREAHGFHLDHTRALAERRLLFLEVAGVEASRARVYDLTVPGTHSFVANGFVNHNTFLAVAMAMQALWAKRVNRIILARPAVEAGEKLGFLPGDLQDKVDPYLRPLYDALFDLADFERVTKLLEKRVIEVAPLAFMRGRTLSDAFIILDEAQNTTTEQMKMFLTRIGYGSKAVITGDLTQIDLPAGRRSGLVEAERIIKGIDGIEFIYFTEKDVVRHRLVQMIIRAYDEHSRKSYEGAT
jgi:phosphate starvation-inducible protein PhoH